VICLVNTVQIGQINITSTLTTIINTLNLKISEKSIKISLSNERRANKIIQFDQDSPDICCFSDGSFVIVWQSYDADDDWDVYFRIFNSDGTPRGPNETRANSYTTGYQKNPAVCCINDSYFVMVWWGESTVDTIGIYARIFDSNGNPLTGEISVNVFTSGAQQNPDVCCLLNGTFIVTWEGVHDLDSWGISARVFNSSGIARTNDIEVNTYTTDDQRNPSICCFPNGSFVIVWESYWQDGNNYGVFLKTYDYRGVATSGDVQVNTVTDSSQYKADICCINNSHFIVTWQSHSQDAPTGAGVFTKIFTTTPLDNVTDDIQVNIFTTNDQIVPTICCFSDGSFIIAWSSYNQPDDNSNYGVFTRYFGVDGIGLTNEILVNTHTDNYQESPAICCLPNGRIVIAWESQGQDNATNPNARGVYFKVGSITYDSYSGGLEFLLMIAALSGGAGDGTGLLIGIVAVAAIGGGLGFYIWKSKE